MRESILDVLVNRDGMAPDQAEDMIEAAQAELADCLERGDMAGAEDICADWFGLEPDYIDDLMEF